MTPLPDLIGHWLNRAEECSHEIDELVNRFNAGNTRSWTENDLRMATTMWQQERRIARDTAAWLATLDRRNSTPAAEEAA